MREEVGVDEPAADGDDQRQDDGDGRDAQVVVLAWNRNVLLSRLYTNFYLEGRLMTVLNLEINVTSCNS